MGTLCLSSPRKRNTFRSWLADIQRYSPRSPSIGHSETPVSGTQFCLSRPQIKKFHMRASEFLFTIETGKLENNSLIFCAEKVFKRIIFAADDFSYTGTCTLNFSGSRRDSYFPFPLRRTGCKYSNFYFSEESLYCKTLSLAERRITSKTTNYIFLKSRALIAWIFIFVNR